MNYRLRFSVVFLVLSFNLFAFPTFISKEVYPGEQKTAHRFGKIIKTCNEKELAGIGYWEFNHDPGVYGTTSALSFFSLNVPRKKIKMKKRIQTHIQGLTYYHDIALAPDCGFVVVGQQMKAHGYEGLVIRYDKLGNVVWTRPFLRPGAQSYINTVTVDAAGITLFGQLGRIEKWDWNANALWQIPFLGRIYAAHEKQNEEYVVVGTKVEPNNTSNSVLLNISGGTIVSEFVLHPNPPTSMGTDYTLDLQDLIPLANSEYITHDEHNFFWINEAGQTLNVEPSSEPIQNAFLSSKGKLVGTTGNFSDSKSSVIFEREVGGPLNWTIKLPVHSRFKTMLFYGLEPLPGVYLFAGGHNMPKQLNAQEDISQAFITMIDNP